MEYTRIDSHGISYLEKLDGTDWQWGMDYTCGDLFEAEQLFQDEQEIRQNRLVFVRYPEPRLYEPLKAWEGQYFGKPCFDGGRIYFLLVDFQQKEILIYRCASDMESATVQVRLPLGMVPDCYNLMLHGSPLTLTRQGHENVLQVVWPDKGSFPIDPAESLDCRDGDQLIFSQWHEDPEYREEVVVRKYPDGEVLERMDGTLMTMPDGRKWLFA